MGGGKMSKQSFIDQKVKDDLIQDMEKRTKLNAEIERHIDEFMNCVSSATIYSIMSLVIKKGHPQQIKHMKEVKERYETEGLLLDDTLFLLDMFEKKLNELFEDDE